MLRPGGRVQCCALELRPGAAPWSCALELRPGAAAQWSTSHRAGDDGRGRGRPESRFKESLVGPPAIFPTIMQEGRHILSITQSLIRV